MNCYIAAVVSLVVLIVFSVLACVFLIPEKDND